MTQCWLCQNLLLLRSRLLYISNMHIKTNFDFFFCHKFDSQIVFAKKPVTWVCEVISTYLTEEKWPHEKKIKIGSTHYYLGQITINLSPDLLKFKSIHCEHYLMHEKTEKMNWGCTLYSQTKLIIFWPFPWKSSKCSAIQILIEKNSLN